MAVGTVRGVPRVGAGRRQDAPGGGASALRQCRQSPAAEHSAGRRHTTPANLTTSRTKPWIRDSIIHKSLVKLFKTF